MIYYVIPELKVQLTWGGDYIANLKNLNLSTLKIGQSYEFHKKTKLIPAKILKNKPISKYPYILLLDKKIKDDTIKPYIKHVIDINKLDTKEIFGTPEIPNLLIKFTQSKGTSFQIHCKEKTKKFQPKPEAWYFFNKGKITLGLRPNIDIDIFKETCENIFKLSKKIAAEIKSKKISLDEARREINQYIEMNDPLDFVNIVILEKERIVDNTLGGIHHSWEEDEELIPFGNILYEVQQDQSDEASTLRCYDKGKILDDGTLRPLQIDAYFENIKKGRKNNEPRTLIKTKIRLKEVKKWSLNKVFNNQYFQMDELIVKKEYTVENLGFRHVFVRRGNGTLIADDERIELMTGYSYIIPAAIENIKIINAKKYNPADRTNASGLILMLTYEKFLEPIR